MKEKWERIVKKNKYLYSIILCDKVFTKWTERGEGLSTVVKKEYFFTFQIIYKFTNISGEGRRFKTNRDKSWRNFS